MRRRSSRRSLRPTPFSLIPRSAPATTPCAPVPRSPALRDRLDPRMPAATAGETPLAGASPLAPTDIRAAPRHAVARARTTRALARMLSLTSRSTPQRPRRAPSAALPTSAMPRARCATARAPSRQSTPRPVRPAMGRAASPLTSPASLALASWTWSAPSARAPDAWS